jgi:hypothetical protein
MVQWKGFLNVQPYHPRDYKNPIPVIFLKQRPTVKILEI